MDYKKKYEDALAIVKYYISKIDLGDKALNVFEEAFPELKKSDNDDKDESIRENLIEYLSGKRIVSNSLEDINIDDTLVWLEKQGKQKYAKWSDDDEICFYKAMLAINQAKIIVENKDDMRNFWHAELWLKSIKQRMKGEQL